MQQASLRFGQPYVRRSATSRAAAESLAPRALNHFEAVVLRAFHEAGPRGLTDEECQDVTRIDPSTQRPRRVSLVALGRLRDSGEKRATRRGRLAVVWVAA